MLDELKKQFSSAKILITLLIIAVSIYLLQIAWQVLSLFSDVIIMLISAWLVSIVLEPIVDRLSRWTRIHKVAIALIVYLIFFGLIGYMVFLFIPEVGTQIQTLTKVLPAYLKPFPEFINKMGDIVSNYLTNSLTYIPSVANFFLSVFIVLIISFYFVIDKHKIGAEMFKLIPKKWHKDAVYIEEVINTTFVSFLRVQLFFGLVCGIATAIILAIFGIPYIASTSFISGLLNVIPLLGPILGVIPPLLVSFAIDPTKALFIFIAILVADQIIFNIIGPKILGKAFKMHPVIVLISFFIGAKIAGAAGAILAIPVLGILIVLLHRLFTHFFNTEK